MGLIPDEHKAHLKVELDEKLTNEVKILLFTQEVECPFCQQTRQLIEELAALTDKIKVEIYDFVADAAKAKEYGVDKIPAIVISDGKSYGMKYYGLPYGYEFQTLLEAVINASRGTTDLSEEVKTRLKEIKTPVHIQVFVTLTCPHCPVAASTAHKFALENDLIKADVIDASEFPQLAIKHAVVGVPKIIINEKTEFIGAVPEDIFLEYVMLAAT